MKKLGLVLLLFTNFLNAQGNLQFNRVVNISIDDTAEFKGKIIGTLTVPAGKVFKLEYASMYRTTNSLYGIAALDNYKPGVERRSQILIIDTNRGNPIHNWLMIGDIIVWNSLHKPSTAAEDIHPITEIKYPIWYGPGTYNIEASTGAYDSGGGTYVFTRDIIANYSGIEFNVIP